MGNEKPLGSKAYGHVPHLPGSRTGPGDHMIAPGQALIATEKVRDKKDSVWVQEKIDGSCVAVAKINGEIVPLIRSGYRAIHSHYKQHILFHYWALDRWAEFSEMLNEGERAVGEWIAQAHGTKYILENRDPFVLFDIMTGTERLIYKEMLNRNSWENFQTPMTFAGPMKPKEALRVLGIYGFHGATDPIEGVVYRVEREGKVDFLTKYVRPDKVDGSYLESTTGKEPVWNWFKEFTEGAE